MNFQAGLISVITQRIPRQECTSSRKPSSSTSLQPTSTLSTNLECTPCMSPPPSPNPTKSRLQLHPMKHAFLQAVAAALVLLACSNLQLVKGDGPNCMQNGMGPQNLYQNGEMNPDYMWSRIGSQIYVPVVMDETYTDRQLKRILGGFKEIEKKTCVSFHYFNNHTIGNLDHVYVTRQREGCWSYIGRIGGRQEMSLPRGCMSHRTAVHEMIHALGFAHEHVRSDRDNYITVHWKNIMPGRERNFVKRKTKSSDPYGPYDYGSIMHYDQGAFSFNGQDTITPKKHGARIGLDDRMSHWDTKKVNRMYKCGNIFGGGGGGGGGYGHGHGGYSPDENEISNFIDEGYAEGEADPDVAGGVGGNDSDGDGDGDGHAHGHGHGHGHAVADGPPSGPGRDEVFGYESSHDDRRPVHSPIQHDHGHGHSRGHNPHAQNHVEPTDDDDDYFRPTHGPFPSPRHSPRGRGRNHGHGHNSHHESPGNYYNRDDEHSPGPGHSHSEGPVQESPFPFGAGSGGDETEGDFQSHSPQRPGPGYGSGTNASPNGIGGDGGGGALSYSHREDHPSSDDSNLNGRQPTVFDGPPQFFEKCFPFC